MQPKILYPGRLDTDSSAKLKKDDSDWRVVQPIWKRNCNSNKKLAMSGSQKQKVAPCSLQIMWPNLALPVLAQQPHAGVGKQIHLCLHPLDPVEVHDCHGIAVASTGTRTESDRLPNTKKSWAS